MHTHIAREGNVDAILFIIYLYCTKNLQIIVFNRINLNNNEFTWRYWESWYNSWEEIEVSGDNGTTAVVGLEK